MLNGERFDINGEYTLWVPTADYYTADGKKLDKIGIEPDIRVKSKKALDYVINNMLK